MKYIKHILLFLLFIAGCSNINDNRMIARVGNRPVNVKEFVDHIYSSVPPRHISGLNEEQLQYQLDALLEKTMYLTEAYENHLDKDSLVVNKTDKVFKNILHNKVVIDQIVDPLIPESEYKDRYDKMSREIKAKHIFLPKAKEPEKNEKIIETLSLLRADIDRGADFESLAREYSRDSLTAGKGGNLGFVKWPNRELGQKFMDVLYKLKKGELSQVVETQKGYHLIYMVEERALPIIPYKYQREFIQKEFFKEKSNKLSIRYQEWLKDLETKHAFELENDNIETFVNIAKTKIDSMDQLDLPVDFKVIKSSVDTSMILMYIDNKDYKLNTFFNDLKDIYPQNNVAIYSKERITKTLELIGQRKLINQLANEKRYYHDKEIKAQKEKAKHKFMIELLETRLVDDEIADSEYKAYYDENVDEFNNINKYNVQEILITDKDLANTIYDQLKNGADFDNLAKKYTERKEFLGTTGKIGYIASNQFGIVGKTAVNLKKGDISLPLKNGKQYSIVKLLDIEKGGKVPWENLVPNVKVQVKKKYAAQRRENWKEELKNKYKIIKYETELKPLIL